MNTDDEADRDRGSEPDTGRVPGPGRIPTGVHSDDVDSRVRLIDTPIGKLALVRNEDAVVAIDAWCPHLDGPLWEGTTARGEVACPWHAWRYSLSTGRCTWAPRGDAEEAAETEIRVLETETDPDGQIFVLNVDEGLERPESSPPGPASRPGPRDSEGSVDGQRNP